MGRRSKSMSVGDLARLAGDLHRRLESAGEESAAAAELLYEARVVTAVLADELARVAALEESAGTPLRGRRRIAG